MSPRHIGIYLPEKKMKQVDKYRETINFSQLFWEAFDRAVILQEGVSDADSLRGMRWSLASGGSHTADVDVIINDSDPDESGDERCYARVTGYNAEKYGRAIAALPVLYDAACDAVETLGATLPMLKEQGIDNKPLEKLLGRLIHARMDASHGQRS
jgi:hypothetical protein